MGIGNIHDSELREMSNITAPELQSIDTSGCIGEINGNYFTIEGEIVRSTVTERVIAVKFPMRCPVIAAAGGSKKVVSIVGAIRSGLIQGLITDEQTAEEVIAILRSS